MDHYFINNKEHIVEYNGVQHYEPYRYKRGIKIKLSEKIFKDQQTRDEWLRRYCKNKNIKLIEIDGRHTYTERDIKNIIKKELL